MSEAGMSGMVYNIFIATSMGGVKSLTRAIITVSENCPPQ